MPVMPYLGEITSINACRHLERFISKNNYRDARLSQPMRLYSGIDIIDGELMVIITTAIMLGGVFLWPGLTGDE